MMTNNFNLTESIYEVLKVMDDKRAGKLIKAVGEYKFNNKIYTDNDTLIKTNFILIKQILDSRKGEQEFCQGECKAKSDDGKKRNCQRPNPCGRIVINDEDADELTRTLFSALLDDVNPAKK
jgi:hypothetical protein